MNNETNLKSAYDSLQKKELEQRKTIKQMSERIKHLEALVSKNESLHLVSHQRELLKSFCKYIDLENSAHPDDIKIDIENHLKIFNCG